MNSDDRSFRFGIQRMTSGDVPAVVEIECTHQREPWSASAFLEELHKLHALCFVARLDARDGKGKGMERRRSEAQVIGYICSWVVVDEVQILNLAVHRDYWRRGVGRGLLERTLEEGRKRGCAYAVLEVRPSNEAALALYGSMGFRRASERPGFYVEGRESAIVMVLDLGVNGQVI